MQVGEDKKPEIFPPPQPPQTLLHQGYKPPDEPVSEYQTIPLNKIEDFGVHAKQYYPLDISFFKSSLDAHMLDLLWNKYWVNTLSSSPLLGNRDFVVGQINDLGAGPPSLPCPPSGYLLRVTEARRRRAPRAPLKRLSAPF